MPILMHFIILFGAYAHVEEMQRTDFTSLEMPAAIISPDLGGYDSTADTDRHLIICTKQKPNLHRIFYDPIICINLIGTENRAIMKTRSLKGGLEIEANQVTHKQQRVVITPDLAYLGYRRQSMTPRKASVSRAAAAKVAAGRSIKG